MKNPTTRKRARKRLFIHKTKHFTKLSARTLCRLFLFALMFLLVDFVFTRF